jgi:aspartate kinase
MIIQSQHQRLTNDITFTVSKDDLPKTVEVLEKVNKEIKAGGVVYDPHLAKVSIVGVGMISQPGVAAKMFETLGKAGINIELISTSEIKISCVVQKKEAHKAVRMLHKAFE